MENLKTTPSGLPTNLEHNAISIISLAGFRDCPGATGQNAKIILRSEEPNGKANLTA